MNIINVYAQQKWIKLNGPVGGAITALTAQGDTIIAGTGLFKGSIYYSFDNGGSWEESKIKFNNRITDFTMPSNDGAITSVYTSGLYKSYDYVNWDKTLNDPFVFSLMNLNDSLIYAGSVDGRVLRTSDFGKSWFSDYNNPNDPYIRSFVLYKDTIAFAGSHSKILRKYGYAQKWQTVKDDSMGSDYQIFKDDSDNLYAFTVGTNFFKSGDGGNTWEHLDTTGLLRYGNEMYSCLYNHRLIGGMGETGSSNGYGIALSDDSGYTWRWSNNKGLPPKFLTVTKLAKSGNNTYLGTNAAGVFKSTDFGDSWFPINNGITAANTMDICFDKEGNMYTANSSNGIQKSIDKGETWEVINNGLTNSYLCSVIADDNDNLIAGTAEGAFLSTDKGENWIQTADVGNNYVYKLYKDKRNRIYSLNVSGGFYRTTDLGNSWERLDDSSFERTTIRSMVVDEDENIYAGTNGNWIYKSTDDGETWALVREGTTEPSTYFRKLDIAPNGDIYAATRGDGLLRSTDKGNTWNRINVGNNSTYGRSLGISKAGEIYVSFGETYYTSSPEKLYCSKDNGNTWEDCTSNMNLIQFQKIIFDNQDNVYLATDESVWKSNPDSIATEVVEEEIKDYKYNLSQNYPNPFNPSTTIKYIIPKNSLVTLKVYDVLGREVKTLVNEYKTAGDYNADFNASHLASGIYLYRITAGKYTAVRKMQLLK